MVYCCTELERKGTCYHEFQRGRFNGVFWKEDSLLLHDDNLFLLHLAKLFRNVIPSYDECGETEINKKQWDEICMKASEIGGDTEAAIAEINCWAEQVFQEEEVITILGL